MNKKAILIFFLFCNLWALTAQNNEWVTVKDLEKEYKIDFPVQPNESTQPVSTAVGEVSMKMYMLDQSADLNSDILIYMTAYTVYPPDSGKYDDPETIDKMLDGSVSGAVQNTNGTLISSTKGKFNGFDSVESKIDIQSGQYIIHMKGILVSNKLYLIQTIYAKENEDNLNDKRFFDSFELIKTR